MTPLMVGVVALAGGVGAALRFVVDGVVGDLVGRRWPWGIAVVNVSGSFLLGLVTGLAAASAWPTAVVLVVGPGLLGGYTTFSTASVDAVRLVLDGRWTAALADVLGVLAASVLAAAAGLALGLLA